MSSISSAPSDGASRIELDLRVRLIGQMDIRARDGSSLLPAGRKTRALFAMLALTLPRSLSRTRAAETLWSRRPSDQARASLRQELHRLLDGFGAIGPRVLDIARDQIQLRPGSCWVDANELQRATLEDPAPLDLLNGTLLDGMTGIDPALDSWIAAERERLSDWSRTLADRILQAQTDVTAQIEAANRLLTIDRAHEGAWRSLIRAYAASGDPAMAMQAYERCSASLAERLKRSPSAETEQLIAEISGDMPTPPPVTPEAKRPPAEPVPSFGSPVGEPPRLGIRRLRSAESADGEQTGVPGSPIASLEVTLANEIGAALMRFRWISVVCLVNQSAPRDRSGVDQPAVDLMLEGSIARVDGDRIRVELSLQDLRAGGIVVWMKRFEGPAAQPLALQDDIAGAAAAQIEAEMMPIEARHASMIEARRGGRPPAGEAPAPTAYHLCMLATAAMRDLRGESYAAAEALLRRAIAIEPGHAASWCMMAIAQMMIFSQGWTEDDEATVARAAEAAERALTLDPRDARNLSVAGNVAGYMQRRNRMAMALHERALATNPNLPMAWAFSAFGHLFAGDTATAERHLARYKSLTPELPIAHRYDSAFIYVQMLKRDFSAAAQVGREVSAINPQQTLPLRPYLSALGHLGARDEAAYVLARLRKLQPRFSLAWWAKTNPFEREEDSAMVLEGLRRAGVES